MRKTARELTQSVSKGFTLVELLVVIAIIAILAVIVGVVINPIELRKRANDATRLSDLANLQQAINVAAQEATASGVEILCFNTTAPCTEGTSPIGANTRKSDGSGWIKVNLSAQKSVSIPTLPVDPNNSAASLYSYYSDGNAWEINAKLESEQQKDKMKNDGGNDDNKYEVGSDLTLIDP